MRFTLRRRLACLASLLVLLPLVSAVPASAATRPSTVRTDKGSVAGFFRRREPGQPLAQCPHSVHPSARSGDFVERIVEIVHCSAYRQPAYPRAR